MKRVQKLVVGTAFSQAASLVDHVAATAGNVGVYNAITGLPAVPGDNEVIIAVKCEDSDLRPYVEQSQMRISDITSARGAGYIASAPKRVDIDMNGIAAPSAQGGERYEIFVTDYNDYNYIIGRKRIEYEAIAGDGIAEVVAGLTVAINEDVSMPNLIATDLGGNILRVEGAAVGGSGSTNVINNFRADYEILFEIILGENMFGLATTTVTPPVQGCGTFREVRKLEEIHKGYKGYLNRVIYPTSVNIQYKSLSPAQGVVGYDMYSIEHKSPQYTETEGDVHFQVVTNVAINEADAQAFETYFDTLL